MAVHLTNVVKCLRCGWKISLDPAPPDIEVQTCMAMECCFAVRPVLVDTMKRETTGVDR